jgi:hypothetical protein
VANWLLRLLNRPDEVEEVELAPESRPRVERCPNCQRPLVLTGWRNPVYMCPVCPIDDPPAAP